MYFFSQKKHNNTHTTLAKKNLTTVLPTEKLCDAVVEFTQNGLLQFTRKTHADQTEARLFATERDWHQYLLKQSVTLWKITDQRTQDKYYLYHAWGAWQQYKTLNDLYAEISSGTEHGIWEIQRLAQAGDNTQWIEHQTGWFVNQFVSLASKAEAQSRLYAKQQQKHQSRQLWTIGTLLTMTLPIGMSLSPSSLPTIPCSAPALASIGMSALAYSSGPFAPYSVSQTLSSSIPLVMTMMWLQTMPSASAQPALMENTPSAIMDSEQSDPKDKLNEFTVNADSMDDDVNTDLWLSKWTPEGVRIRIDQHNEFKVNAIANPVNDENADVWGTLWTAEGVRIVDDGADHPVTDKVIKTVDGGYIIENRYHLFAHDQQQATAHTDDTSTYDRFKPIAGIVGAVVLGLGGVLFWRYSRQNQNPQVVNNNVGNNPIPRNHRVTSSLGS